MTSDKGQRAQPVGYIISKDRYLKRDELGVVYQLCVSPDVQRGLIGAALVKAAFERAAYGCRLFCLWCAQDLEANRFWESLGFVPLAFRAGGKGTLRRGSGQGGRVHIFWQKRICEGDTETKWWYPFQTNGGAIREDRVVWPIPPGVHWSEVRAVEVPGAGGQLSVKKAPRALPSRKHGLETRVTGKRPAGPGPGMVGILVGGRIKYVPKPGYVAPVPPAVASLVPPVLARVKKKTTGEATVPRKTKEKLDPTFLAKARELRDRWMEQVNSGHVSESAGKYDVARALPAPSAKRLPARNAA